MKQGSSRKFSHTASRFPLSLDRRSRQSPGSTKSHVRSSLPFVKRCLYIHAIRIRMNSVMRAGDTYSWRNSFAGNHEEGNVSSHRATPRRTGPLLFFLALFVFGDLRYALFIVVPTLDQHTPRHSYQYVTCI